MDAAKKGYDNVSKDSPDIEVSKYDADYAARDHLRLWLVYSSLATSTRPHPGSDRTAPGVTVICILHSVDKVVLGSLVVGKLERCGERSELIVATFL